MATDKRINYDVQGGVKNYLGKQKEVKAPLHWRSGPKHPSTELAYITKKEKDLLIKKDLHRSLKGGVNRGPSGIMSLNGWGSRDSSQNRAGSSISAGMDKSASDAGWSGASAAKHGSKHTTAMSPATEKALEAQQNARLGIDPTARQNKWGGLGGLLRGVLGIFGGIPGKMLSGIMTAKNWAKNKAIGIGDEFEEFKSYDNFADYLNRNKNPALGNTLGLAVNRQIAPIGPGKRVGEDTGFYGMGSQYDASRRPGNLSPNMGANNFLNNTAPVDNINYSNQLGNLYSDTGLGAKDGGRIGYAFGRGPVLDENVDESTIDIMNDQGVPHSEMVGKSPFELRIDELMDEGMSWQEAYTIASEEFGQVVEGESDQGIASIV